MGLLIDNLRHITEDYKTNFSNVSVSFLFKLTLVVGGVMAAIFAEYMTLHFLTLLG